MEAVEWGEGYPKFQGWIECGCMSVFPQVSYYQLYSVVAIDCC